MATHHRRRACRGWAHLFGDIFERDNLDWQSRELATVAALAVTPGVEPQLRSHMAASLRVGLTAAQLRQLVQLLADQGDADAAKRVGEALSRHAQGDAVVHHEVTRDDRSGISGEIRRGANHRHAHVRADAHRYLTQPYASVETLRHDVGKAIVDDDFDIEIGIIGQQLS